MTYFSSANLKVIYKWFIMNSQLCQNTICPSLVQATKLADQRSHDSVCLNVVFEYYTWSTFAVFQYLLERRFEETIGHLVSIPTNNVKNIKKTKSNVFYFLFIEQFIEAISYNIT